MPWDRICLVLVTLQIRGSVRMHVVVQNGVEIFALDVDGVQLCHLHDVVL